MPRPLIFSNGSLYIGIDDRFRIRDLFYPHVGLYNHLSGHTIRMGVWIDGVFSWVEEDGWSRELAYEPGTLVGVSKLTHPAYGIELVCRDAVDPLHPRFERNIEVRNLRPGHTEVRIFFAHDLRIAETDIGDTALFTPFLDGMIHYKGPHWFLFRLRSSFAGTFEYATGIKGFGGLEGTWRDAEDGHLSMNPIAQGSVDSTMSTRIELAPNEVQSVQYEIVCGAKLEDLEASASSPRASSADSSRDALREITDRLKGRLEGLDAEEIELAKRSLLVLLAHCDHGGAILAATDSDIMATNRANYCYTWPRDGAHVCMVLDRLGIHEPTRRYFRFCARLLSPSHPVLLQKYRPDGTLGATWHPWIVDGKAEIPFQEDESASMLLALAEHFRMNDDRMLRDELYGPMVLPMADYLASYRDSKTGLPMPSYDLWEERRGVHTYTCAAVFAGLLAAAEMAEGMGDPRAVDYHLAARQVQDGILNHLIDRTDGHFFRRLEAHPDGSTSPDPVWDSSSLFVALFGVLDSGDPIFGRHLEGIERHLKASGNVGGIARYSNDYYFRTSHEATGNPWIICTMWLAQCQIARAQTEKDLESPRRWLKWALGHSGSTQILPEQLQPETGSPLSVSPLTWSHAEFLKTCLDWADRRRSLYNEAMRPGVGQGGAA